MIELYGVSGARSVHSASIDEITHESRPLTTEEKVLKMTTVLHPCSGLRYHMEMTIPAPEVFKPSKRPKMYRTAHRPWA